MYGGDYWWVTEPVINENEAGPARKTGDATVVVKATASAEDGRGSGKRNHVKCQRYRHQTS